MVSACRGRNKEMNPYTPDIEGGLGRRFYII